MFDFVSVMQGTDGVTLMLGARAHKASDFRPAWKKAHDVINRGVRKQFSTQGAYMGEKWRPLTERYARWKRKKYPGKPIERRTDRMWQSLVNPKHNEHVFRSFPQQLEVGTINPYAQFQHHGAPTNNLPARRLVGLTQNEIIAIFKLMQEHLIKRDEAGFQRIRF